MSAMATDDEGELPLLDEGSVATPASRDDAKSEKLSLSDAFALLVSHQIGSGVFSSPSQVNRHARAPGFALVIWLVSGILGWTGATCFAELGVALPLNGGMLEYLRYIYSDGLAFMAAWTWIMAIKPCSVAVQSITFSQYWIDLIFAGSMPRNGWQAKGLALASVYVITGFNMISLNASAKMMKFFLIVKISALVLLFLFTCLSLFAGVHLGEGKPSTDWKEKNWFGHSNPDWPSGIVSGLGESIFALYAGLWAYSGWDSANMVAGEIQNPSRNLPLALHTAQPLVIFSFVLANVCYYLTVPWADIDATNTIAVSIGNAVGGFGGGLAFAVLVSLACLGSMNVNVFIGGRLVVSAAQADWLPQWLGKYSSAFEKIGNKKPNGHSSTESSETPVRAMLFNAIVTTIYIVVGSFGSLVTFIGLAEYTFFGITIFGLLKLRVREPNLPRPYRPNIILPVVFVGVCFFLVVFSSFEAPVQALLLGGLILAGVARNYVFKSHGSPLLTANTGDTSRADYRTLHPADREGRHLD